MPILNKYKTVTVKFQLTIFSLSLSQKVFKKYVLSCHRVYPECNIEMIRTKNLDFGSVGFLFLFDGLNVRKLSKEIDTFKENLIDYGKVHLR